MAYKVISNLEENLEEVLNYWTAQGWTITTCNDAVTVIEKE